MKTIKLFSALFCLLLSANIASAYDFNVGELYYEKNADGTTVTVVKRSSYNNPYTSLVGALDIPPSVTYLGVTYTVTSIGDAVFSACHGLTSLTIPNTITSIGNQSFQYCSGLSSIIVDSDNQKYDSRNNCNAIIETKSNSLIAGCKNSIIPISVTSIRGYAFSGCSGLTSVTIPNSVTSIGQYAFGNCNGLSSVTIPDSVTSIDTGAFYSCMGLVSVIVGKSVISIPDKTFLYCTSLTSATLPNTITSIGKEAFAYCNLTSVTIPSSVTTIGDGAFLGSTNIKYLTIDNNKYASISVVSDSKERLESLVLGNSVTTLEASAFSGCNALKSVTIPNSITSIGASAFYGCNNIDTLNIDNNKYASISTFSGSKYNLKTLTLGNSVTTINTSAFSGCTSLNSLTISDNLTTIGSEAFYNCNGLKFVHFPKSVTSIGNSAFSGCDGLTILVWNATNCSSNGNMTTSNISMVSIGDEVQTLPEGFVKESKITSLSIPNSVTTIGKSAFEGCGGLTNLVWNATNCSSNGNMATSNITVVSIGDEVQTLPEGFVKASKITSLSIPNSVTNIGKSSFEGCRGLTSVTIPNSVTSIERDVFKDCSGLRSVIIPNSVTSIAERAFYNCSGLTSLKIPKSVTSIGNSAFSGCSNLDEIYYLGANTPFAAATTRTYVVDKTKFKTPHATIKMPYNIIQYVDFNNSSFAYSLQIPDVTYTNNLPEWNCNLINAPASSDWNLSIGDHNVYYKFGFTREEEAFDVEIPFYYTITKKALTAKANDASRIYGDDNPQFTISYEGFVDGEGLSSITTPPTASTVATTTSDVGSYPITLTGGSADNYTFTYQSGTLSVTKAPLEAKINDAQRIYGQANPAFSMTYTGLKNGETIPKWTAEPVYQTQAIQTSPVGAYPIYLKSCEPKNYYLTSITKGTLTVSAKDLIIKANDASRPYGDDNPEFGFTCSGFVNGDDEQELSKLPTIQTNATKQSGVGSYDIIPSGAVARNYTISYQNGTLNVTKRPLTAKPTPISRYYGDPNPDLTIDYTSFVNGDDESSLTSVPVATTTATTTSNVGSYAIKLTGGSATNYDITCENGILTVVKAPMSIKIDDKERIYGDSNPSFTYTLQGLKNGETVPTWIVKPTLSTTATKTSPVGFYDITMNEPEAKNYEITSISNGNLSINKAMLTARANNASRLYFEDNPSFTCSYSGFKNNENSSVISKAPQIYTYANKTTKAGQYPIYINWAEAQNYDFTYVDGTININKRTIVATTPNYSRLYQEPNPQFEVSYSGFVNNETINNFSMVPWVKCNADYNANVGTYPIIIYNGEADNYNFDYRGGYLTVQKKEQTLTWDQDLSNVKLYSNLELTAKASSQLPVSYELDNNDIANIYTAGERVYVECFAEGTVIIRAQQMGNNNWYASSRITKQLKISRFGSVDDVYADTEKCYEVKGHDLVILSDGVELFDTNGRLIYAGAPTRLPLQTGIYIIRHNGKTFKELVK